MKKFRHRSWNHICWVFESRTGTSRFFLNGEYQGSYQIETDVVKAGVPGSDEVFKSAFIIGQEPDAPSPNGGFEEEQVFVGHITELNLWDKILDNDSIEGMGKCKIFEKGNIIGWNLDNFVVSKVKVEDLDIIEDLCKPPEKILVFSEPLSLNQAWAVCSAHGGAVHTPINEDENVEFLKLLQPFTDKCSDQYRGSLHGLE